MRTVRALAPVPVPLPLPVPGPSRRWHVVGDQRHPVAAALLTTAPGPSGPATGTVVVLGTRFTPADNAILLQGIAAARRQRHRLVLIHEGAGGASLLGAAMAERPAMRCLAIQLPPAPPPRAVGVAVALVRGAPAAPGELSVDRSGRVTTTAWRPVEVPPAPPPRPGGGIVVVTGGLGGLGLRAAGALAHLRHLHPVLVDRVAPARLPAPARRHLEMLRRGPTGATVRTVDITDGHAVAAALRGLPEPVALVHCAGVLPIGPVAGCRASDLSAVQAVKVAGLHHVLAALEPGRLASVVVFGSITASEPHANLGAYALANELLRRAAHRLPGLPADTAVVVAEWTLWAGAGMAHDLGVPAQARTMGMIPVPLRPGLDTLVRLLALPAGPAVAHQLKLVGGPHAPHRVPPEAGSLPAHVPPVVPAAVLPAGPAVRSRPLGWHVNRTMG